MRWTPGDRGNIEDLRGRSGGIRRHPALDVCLRLLLDVVGELFVELIVEADRKSV